MYNIIRTIKEVSGTLNETIDEKRKGEIAYAVLLHIVENTPLKLGDIHRRVGQIAQATKIDKEELESFVRHCLLRDILKKELGK